MSGTKKISDTQHLAPVSDNAAALRPYPHPAKESFYPYPHVQAGISSPMVFVREA